MKLSYWEGKTGLDIALIPETPTEVAELLRITLNAKRVPIALRFHIDGKEPQANIWIQKVTEGQQKTSLSNKK